MPLSLKCPHCNQAWSIGLQSAETHVYCPYCTKRLIETAVIRRSLVRGNAHRLERAIEIGLLSIGLGVGVALACLPGINVHPTVCPSVPLTTQTPPHDHADRQADRPVAPGARIEPIVSSKREEPAAKTPVPAPAQFTTTSPLGNGPAISEPSVDSSPALHSLARMDQLMRITQDTVNVKRRQVLSEEQLRKQLLEVAEYRITISMPRGGKQTPHLTPALVAERPELRGLPWRLGNACQLLQSDAQNLRRHSRLMRDRLESAIKSSDAAQYGRRLREMLFHEEHLNSDWIRPAALATLEQMLQAENEDSRLLLVDLLGFMVDPAASRALARRSLFDLSPNVRAAALQKLNQRSRSDYRSILIEGLNYPWSPVVDHAVEALVALQDTEAVPLLEQTLESELHSLPEQSMSSNRIVREMVRINHLRNCTLCHPISTDGSDLIRGLVPMPDRPVPPPTMYYDGREGTFVRADVIYLKQDFSVTQPVANSGPWPPRQRYDYLIRNRPATRNDSSHVAAEHRREALLFALNGLDREWKQRRAREALAPVRTQEFERR